MTSSVGGEDSWRRSSPRIKLIQSSWILLLGLLYGHISRSCGRFFNPQFGTTMEDVTVRTGVSVEFHCSVKHLGRSWVAFSRVAEQQMLISWDVNIFAGMQNKYNLERKEDTWILTVNNVQHTDTGAYMCQVNSVPPISQVANLHVMVPPLINKERSSKDTFVNEGQNATLYCSADGSPPPVYSWRRVAEPSHFARSQLIITNDPDMGSGESVIHRANFTIYKVSRHQMANYECIASNGVEPSDSYVVKLHVLYPPHVEAVHEKVYAAKGSDVRLQCKAQAWPRPNFVWEFNKHVLTSDPLKYHMAVKGNTSIHESIATLIIQNVMDEDFGNYYCLASNERSHHKAVIELSRHGSGDYYNRIPEPIEGSGAFPNNNDDEEGDENESPTITISEIVESAAVTTSPVTTLAEENPKVEENHRPPDDDNEEDPDRMTIYVYKGESNLSSSSSSNIGDIVEVMSLGNDLDESWDKEKPLTDDLNTSSEPEENAIPYESANDGMMDPSKEHDENSVSDPKQNVPRSPNQTAKNKHNLASGESAQGNTASTKTENRFRQHIPLVLTFLAAILLR